MSASTQLLTPEHFEALKLDDFVAIDLETTGLDYNSEDIIEFAAVHFRNGEIHDQLNFYVKPTKKIPAFITRITGITEKDVADALPFKEQLPLIRDFLKHYPLVAHNAGFDLGFLEYHARRSEQNFEGWDAFDKSFHYFPNPVLDTLQLARIYLSFLPAFNLGALVNYFQFELVNAHRALPDAEAAARVFLAVLEIAVKTKLADVQKILQILEPTEEPLKTFFENLALFVASGRLSVPVGIDRAKFSVQANHYNIIGEQSLAIPQDDGTRLIDADDVANFFGEDGDLANEFGVFEPRPPQVTMAASIADAFNDSQFLMVEAGTGTGKSLAYLVPAIKWAVKNYGPQGRVIVSTNTKNLQEQLFFKDLPILNSIMEEKFKAVLLKGKNNYLCLDKWVTVLNDMKSSLTPKERMKILPLVFWVQETETGDIAENNGFRVERNGGLWSKLIAENNYCTGKACKYYDQCFLMRARNNAKEAHVVLVNHSLLFSDLAADNAILSDYYNVIFDEAHNIEKTATDFLGIETTVWQFRDFLNKLYQKERFETGVLMKLKRRLQKSELKPTMVDSLEKMIEELIDLRQQSWSKTQDFFRELSQMLREKQLGDSNYYNTRHRYVRDDRLFDTMESNYTQLLKSLIRLQSKLNDLVEYFRDIPEDSIDYQRQIFQDLTAQLTQCVAVQNNLEFLIEAEWDTYVYWFELPSREDSFDTRLYAAPLDVGNILHEKLFDHLKTAIFTSATMAVNKRFDYFGKRIGIQHLPAERTRTILLDSPFNYPEQVMLGVPSFLPDPASPQYTSELKKLLEKMAVEMPRGTLVLFTAYSMLNNVYQGIRHTFDSEDVLLLGQGIDGGRHAIINRFKSQEGAFLLGTDSFWEGIDVPGKALEQVLITKLPFDVPSDPVIQARSELIKSQGGNPFSEFAIPEAVIRFRQGFGRLIRSRADYGAVLILDTRIVKKFYGKIFLNSLPTIPKILASEDEMWVALENWFSGV